MAHQFASSRLAPAVQLCIALFVGAQSACTPAHSETPKIAEPGDWVLVDGTEGVRVHVDRSTLKRDGARVHSQMRFAFVRETDLTPGGKPYDHTVHNRIDDCATGGVSMQSITYRGADGADVEVTRSAGGVIPYTPGTRAAHITAEICKLAGLPEPVVASVPLADIEANDWRLVGTDRDGAKVWVQSSSAVTHEGAASVVTRTGYPKPRALEDGRAFQTVVNQVSYVCDGSLSGVETSDYYAGSGELLLAVQYDVEKTARPVGRGSLSDHIRKVACAGPALEVPAGFDAGSN